MDKDKQLLSRVVANHLFLSQFEAFRACILSLHKRDPGLATSILQAVVSRAGRLDGVIWSASCPSPAHLAWLSVVELIRFDDVSAIWNMDPELLRLKVEFLLLAQIISSRVSDGLRRFLELEVIEKENGLDGDFESRPEDLATGANLSESSGGVGLDPTSLLDRISDLGARRLREDVGVDAAPSGGAFSFTDAELKFLKKVLIDQRDLLDSLCLNIRRQLNCSDPFDSGLAVCVKAGIEDSTSPSPPSIEDLKALNWIQRNVQATHIDFLKKCLREGDQAGAISHIRFLHLDHGVEESEYRMALHDLIQEAWSERNGYGKTWRSFRQKMLLIYKEALLSGSTQLARLIQDIQDMLLSEEVEKYRASDLCITPPPLQHLLKCFDASDLGDAENVDERTLDVAIRSCMRDMYHYARVSGLHILECIMDTALSAVKKEQLQGASNVLQLFPILQPLVAVMGWDLLAGKTAARRKLMHILWTSKSQVLRLEESPLYEKQSDEVSCVEHLCDLLCYQLDLASFVASVNSGRAWNSKNSLLFSGREYKGDGNVEWELDPFVENFVLERLAVQTPLRVLFDVVPGIKFKDAIELISMQPVPSIAMAWKRMRDIELMHMRYALESAVLALGAMERSALDENDNLYRKAVLSLKDLQSHLESINNIPRKIFMVSIIIALLHMDDISMSLAHGTFDSFFESSCVPASWERAECISSCEGGNRAVVFFTKLLLDILHHNLPLEGIELEHMLHSGLVNAAKLALEWRTSNAKQIIEDWEWRLSVLQRIQPLSDRRWSWKEALTILRAAPSKLLNLCMLRAKYDIGEEAVLRFSLPPEDKASLELAEWVDGAFEKASVEDAVSRVAEGPFSNTQEIDFSAFRSQLGPLAAILLCIDVAVSTARSVDMCRLLLEQARAMLSEIYPGCSPKLGSNYWGQIQEVCIISVTRRVLQRLNDFLEQENSPTLQAILVGELAISSGTEPNRQGQRQRALVILHQMIEDAHKGKRQFLSGKLHNLARALADDEADVNFAKGEHGSSNKKVLWSSEKDGFLGLGLKAIKTPSLGLASGESNAEHAEFDSKETGKKLLGHLSSKPATYLSAFVLYIAAIGDIVDGIDTTHDFNFFSLIYEWPKELLTRLVFERGSTDAAGKVSDIMCVDFVHEVISACVPPVYPPRSGHGWASIPVLPALSNLNVESMQPIQSPKEPKLNCYVSSLGSGNPLYPLQLNIVKHLAKLSPVRAVLACVFGSKILTCGSDSSSSQPLNDEYGKTPDADRLFYEFALDQSDRFPTLNRWIQMQTNLQRVSEFAVISKGKDNLGIAKFEGKTIFKRPRECDSDTESEVDDMAACSHLLTSLSFSKQVNTVSECWLDSPESEVVEPAAFLTFDWEDEGPYERAVERLINEGKLMDALALSDRCLRNGASDRLLRLLIEWEENNDLISGQSQGYRSHNFQSNTWQYCLRLKDKQMAARLALKYLRSWELDAAMDVMTMCSCHLPHDDQLKAEIVRMRHALKRYSHILSADDRYSSWQEVEIECKEDPEGLALRLAGKGAVSAALEVAECASLSIDLRRELQGRQLVKLLTTDPLCGGGPAEASRFLSSLRDSDDALPVAMGAMQLLPDLRSKQLLVHFFLKRRATNLSDAEVSRLNSWALGLRVLATLPLPWQQRCSALHEHPHLILEVLLMRKQLESASLILKEFPSLRDNNLILTYAAKAITVSVVSSPREPKITLSNTRPRQKTKAGIPSRSNFTNSLSNLQKEARRAFSWAPRDTGNKITPKEVYRKRKSSGLTSDRAAWEEMTGIQEDRVSVYTADGQDRLPSMSVAEEWILTGDTKKDGAVRLSHRYESSPDIILFKSLLSLCSEESVSAKGALDLCINQMKNVLSAQQLPLHASMETHSRAYHATETFVQGLVYAKSQLRKLAGSNDVSIASEKSDDASSDTGSFNASHQYSDELSELLSQADIWLGRAELLQSLLGSGIVASLDDIADKDSSAHLRDRLIEDERYSMAVYTCRKCKIDAFPVWNAWGHALIRMEHYAQARVKFKQAFQLLKGDLTPVILEIVNTMEGGPPVDVSSVRSMYEHLAKSAPTILDDSLSADSYLNVLYMPSTFPRSERSRRSQETPNKRSHSSSSDFDEGPRSNLDNVRYLECINYLQEYACQQILGFMFRHGHYTEACMLFFPENAIPSPPQPSLSGAVTSSSSPQRHDPLATDYGTIDDLCEFCIGYGAMSDLENVISTRIASNMQDAAVTQHTSAALVRICNYCETHKHFNYLYKFQVIKKDHVAAGLCCIQLFMNSSSQEDAVKHLEHAKMHFEDGLLARHRTGESMRLASKAARGKSSLQKVTEEGLIKFSACAAIQVNVLKSFNDTEGPQWKHSLFGNPNDPETFRRRCEIAETLAERNFDLAFRVIYEFNLPAVDIYAGVAASLAERKKGSQLTEFLKNIKGTIDDDDWDLVLGAAINVYANRHKERPDRLIDMLTSSHRKVLACVVCGRLKSAFQIASRSGSVADVQYVAHQALHANVLPVLDMCKQWLAQYM